MKTKSTCFALVAYVLLYLSSLPARSTRGQLSTQRSKLPGRRPSHKTPTRTRCRNWDLNSSHAV